MNLEKCLFKSFPCSISVISASNGVCHEIHVTNKDNMIHAAFIESVINENKKNHYWK